MRRCIGLQEVYLESKIAKQKDLKAYLARALLLKSLGFKEKIVVQCVNPPLSINNSLMSENLMGRKTQC